MKKVAATLEVLNSHFKRFTKPDKTSFSTGEMMDVMIGMIPNSWWKTMAQTGTKLREMELTNLSST